jgi:hypothetical protein
MRVPSPSSLMFQAFWGLTISLLYGVAAGALVFVTSGPSEAEEFLTAFISEYGTLVSFGTIAATAMIVSQSQTIIEDTIEAAFTTTELANTEYYLQKQCFYSRKRNVRFASEMIIMAFIMFRLCHFRLPEAAASLMMIAVCAQYALASYVGRKLRYAGLMLHAILHIDVRRNLFRNRELDDINTAVHIATTLTMLWVYVHVRASYTADFAYDTPLVGKSARIFLLIPAVLAVPVLLMFTYFPREALRKIYNRSIDAELIELRQTLRSEHLNAFEKRLLLLQFSKLSREELRHSLQLTLSDLPLAITLFVMVLEPILKNHT